MKNCWENVNRINRIEVGPEKIPTKGELLNAFENCFLLSGWSFIKWINKIKAPYQCIVNNGKENIDIVLYLKNISNAGWENKPHCKRVQVGNTKHIAYHLLRNETKTRINLIIGYYNYEKPLFAAWNAEEYTNHLTNRSCYIDVEDIIEGYEKGYASFIRSNQELQVFEPHYMTTYLDWYIKNIVPTRSEYTFNKDGLLEIATDLFNAFYEYEKCINYYWDGKSCIIEMKNEGSNQWRQMEWPGFYLEHIAEKILGESLDMSGVIYGNTKIDMFKEIPWDLKSHTINANNPNIVPTNDIDAIYNAIEDFGYIGFVILEGQAVWDYDKSFKKWHDELKGKKSKYVREGEKTGRKSRRRKRAFSVESMKVIALNKEDVERQPSFQNGMKNSNGKDRNSKMMLNYNLLTEKNIILHKSFKKN